MISSSSAPEKLKSRGRNRILHALELCIHDLVRPAHLQHGQQQDEAYQQGPSPKTGFDR